MRFLTLLLLLTPILHAAETLTDVEKGERVFAVHVRSIIQEKCIACHGDDPEKIKGDLDMRDLAGLLAGGETSTDVLVPGHADKSLLLTAITWEDPDYEMPPKENDRLSESQIQKVRNWINWGAPWPNDETIAKWQAIERTRKRTEEGILVKTIGGLSDDWTYRRYQDDAIWAFQPLTTPEVPTSDANHPIDAFITKKLAPTGFTPAPLADARTLLRRATYDLTGLPPTPKEVEDFESDYFRDPTSAFSLLIDRLLASPRYGERWAQHWLDVVRYADTGGFSNDYERSNAWRYRDYVIRSLNEDKPYTDFVREQIAGDELNPEDPEMLVATGFLRSGPFDTAMVDADVSRQMFLDDLVNGVGQTFLGTPMRCCKCHDHKFDPIPTEDYYRMMATFAATWPMERKAPYLEEENCNGFDEATANVQTLIDYATEGFDEVSGKREEAAKEWYAEHGLEYQDVETRKKELDDSKKPPLFVGLNATEEGVLKVRQQDVRVWKRRLDRTKPLAQAVWNGNLKKPNAGSLYYPKEGQILPDPPKSHIYLGGNVSALGKEVTPGVLSATGTPSSDQIDDPYALPTDIKGRRTEFANWLTNPQNPLATRTIVNRIWGYHFAKGIAANPNNIGGKGGLPTHPELLDWLVSQFTESDWSLKSLHRLIMTSEAYQRSTAHPDQYALQQQDPDNELLAYYEPRRLSAEEIRDTMLAVSGELNLEMGGLPSRPEINREVAFQPRMIQFSLAPTFVPDPTPEQRNRRSVYCYKVRGMHDPFLQIFNQADPNESCELRGDAAVSPQAFTLLNSDISTDRSIGFALSLEKQSSTLDDQLTLAYHRTLSRPPTDEELTKLSEFYQEMLTHHRSHTPAPITYPTTIQQTLVEETSGQPFTYTELLPNYTNYTPDPKPSTASPKTRALADICLLLFNSNEFAYVY